MCPVCNVTALKEKGILVVGSQGIPVIVTALKGKISQQKCYSSVQVETVSPAKCYCFCSGKGFPNASVTTLLQQGRVSLARLLQICSEVL